MKKVAILVLLLVLTNVSVAVNEGGSGIDSIVNPACISADKDPSSSNDTDGNDTKTEQETDDQEAYAAYLACLNSLE